MRALSSQRTTLERLAFTRCKMVAVESLMDPKIDLSCYTALKFLSITWAILRVGRATHCHKRLPPRLEHLQVLYDEGREDDRGALDEDWVWLKGLLLNKATLSALRKIDIFSTEVTLVEDDPYFDYNEYYEQHHGRSTATAAQLDAAKAWRLPRSAMDMAADADIELTVTLGYGLGLTELSKHVPREYKQGESEGENLTLAPIGL
jgi:hypothetical protein